MTVAQRKPQQLAFDGFPVASQTCKVTGNLGTTALPGLTYGARMVMVVEGRIIGQTGDLTDGGEGNETDVTWKFLIADAIALDYDTGAELMGVRKRDLGLAYDLDHPVTPTAKPDVTKPPRPRRRLGNAVDLLAAHNAGEHDADGARVENCPGCWGSDADGEITE